MAEPKHQGGNFFLTDAMLGESCDRRLCVGHKCVVTPVCAAHVRAGSPIAESVVSSVRDRAYRIA